MLGRQINTLPGCIDVSVFSGMVQGWEAGISTGQSTLSMTLMGVHSNFPTSTHMSFIGKGV